MKFKDAVLNLIKTCPYPEPTIANVLGYDKKVKIYTHQELMQRHKDAYYPGAKYDPIVEEYTAINYNSRRMFIKNEFFNQEMFRKWNPKKEKQ